MLTRDKMRHYQRRAAKFLKDNPQSGMFVDMGMGKTVSTLTALADLLAKGEIKRVLIVAPLRVVEGVWRQEARKWEHLRHLTFKMITGNEEQRLMALNSKAQIHLINVDNLRWLIYVLKHYCRRRGAEWPYDTLVIDESSMFKTAKTKRFTTVRHTVSRFERRHILTGTPAPNGIEDIWAQVYILDKGQRLRSRVGEFRSQFFDKGGFMGKETFERDNTREQVAARISDIILTLRAEDHLDLPPMIKSEEWIDLPPKARKVYDQMEREMFLELEKGTTQAAHAAVVTAKCHQIANGAIFLTDEGNETVWQKIHDAKLEALEAVVEETGCPMLVAYYFKHDLARLRKKWPKAPCIAEAKGAKQLDAMQAAWNDGKFPIMFVHPQGAGHGLNLQHGGYALTFFSLLFGHEPYRQVIERIGPARQVGTGRTVLIKHILARDTVDEALLASQRFKFDNERGFIKAVRDYRDIKQILR